MIYRTWRFFPSLPPTLSFARAQVRFLGTRTSVRTVYASFLASTITSPGVLVPLTGSPVATTPSCLDLTIQFFQLGCEVPVSQNWGYDNNNWLCPPVCLIVRVIRYMKLCRTQGTLVLSLWKAAFFWNAFNRSGVYWNSFVVNWVYLPKFQGLFVPAGFAIPFSNPGP